MDEETRYAYLVLVRLVFIGGGREAAVDVFPASSHDEAENMARNSIIQTPEGQGVMFGDRFIQPDGVAVLSVKSLAVIDLSVKDNYRWQELLDLFETIAGEGQPNGQTEQDRYFENSTDDTNRGLHPR